jgi:S-disulfanyl-L-cysteine oxidoreductase SoxD
MLVGPLTTTSTIPAMPISSKLSSLLFILAFSACSSAQAPAPDPAPTASATTAPAGGARAEETAAVVPAEQAQRGQNAFLSSCTTCHSSSEFNDTAFQTRWRNRTAADLFDLLSATMPEDAPNSLPAERYVEIVAYLLRLNGFESSEGQEAWDLSALEGLSLASLGGR